MIDMHIHIHIHIHIPIRIHIHIHIHINTYVITYAYTYTYTYTYICNYICTYIYIYIYVYLHTYALFLTNSKGYMKQDELWPLAMDHMSCVGKPLRSLSKWKGLQQQVKRKRFYAGVVFILTGLNSLSS